MNAGVKFVGRKSELAAMRAHCDEGQPGVLSVVGIAGIGKTRLAREYLDTFEQDWETVFVSLLEEHDAAGVLDHVVAACGVVPTGRDDLERACRRLSSSEAMGVVFVIDNAEHVRNEVVSIVERLAELDFVQVVVTSREPLGIVGEQVLQLSSLSHAESVALLRAVAQERGTLLAADDAQELATALDGLPLAIGLAAERTTILSPKQIRSRLRESNRVLSRSGDGRHASLDLALNHSWVHLSEQERELCINLAAFDFALATDVAVQLWPEQEVKALATRLMARSWLSEQQEQGVRCWTMLHAVRSFVREQSSQLAQVEAAERLVSWGLAHASDPVSQWADRLREGTFIANMLKQRGDEADAARVVSRLFLGVPYSQHARVITNLAVELVETLRAREDVETHAAVCSRLCASISRTSISFGFAHDPVIWAERSLEFALDLPGRVKALSRVALAQLEQRDVHAGRATVQKGMALLEGHDVGIDNAAVNDAFTWWLNYSTAFQALGEVDQALLMVERALEAPEANSVYVARALSHRAICCFEAGRYGDSRRAYDEANALMSGASVSERFMTFSVLPAYLLEAEGRPDEAKVYLEGLVASAKSTGNRWMQFYSDCAAGVVAASCGESPSAYLHKAYYKIAHMDAIPISMADGRTLLTLAQIWEGRFDEACEQIARILENEARWLPGPSKQARLMLLASARFARCSRLGHDWEPAKDAKSPSAFDEVVDFALEAVEARSEQRFDERMGGFDLERLLVPGFAMFRFERHVRAWVGAQVGRRRVPVLRIEKSGRLFSIEGKVYDFSRKGTLRRLLLQLARAASEDPMRPVASEAVVREGWPTQKVIDRSALSRAYTTMNRLRTSTNLGPYLESSHEGYRLWSGLQIEWVDKLSP